MMVVTTSWAPVLTFRTPGTAANAIPPNMPHPIAANISRGPGRKSNASAPHAAVIIPTMYWPSTPMLNMPPLKHTATASAEKISGVALARTYPNPVMSPKENSAIAPKTVSGLSP